MLIFTYAPIALASKYKA